MLSQLILTKSFPAAIRRVREHRALGHRTVLITGALDFVVEPLRPLFDDIIAAEMSVDADGTYIGPAHRRAAHRREPGLGPVRLRRGARRRPRRVRRVRRLGLRPADARGRRASRSR